MADFPQPKYAPNKNGGLNVAASVGDGYSVLLKWDRAFPSVFGYTTSYNIYYSTIREDVFTEGIKFVSVPDGYTQGCILELTPGQTYYFAVRGTQYSPDWANLNLLQDGFPNLKSYTEGVLLSDLAENGTEIEVSDIDLWPAFGVVQVGSEWIRYTSKDLGNNTLLGLTRGFLSTNQRFHQTDGYDGVSFKDPVIRFWPGLEDDNTIVQLETVGFFNPNYAYTIGDGYAIKSDIVTTNTSGDASDAAIGDAPRYDGVGWHRTDPLRLLRGECIGTYYGGEQWCADGYSGVGRQTRGVSFEDQILRREEFLLEKFGGEPVVLVKRLYEGIRCSCVKASQEQPLHRCQNCFGTGFVTGYEQFYNPRRSDSRIMVRFDPTAEDIKLLDAGLENEFLPNCWTTAFPRLNDRDFLIRFDTENQEEYRYEILNVTRNTVFQGQSGAQKFAARRVRKTEPIYQWSAFRNTSDFPQTINTTVGLLRGLNNTIIPHTHEVVINENVLTLSDINQTTSTVSGHSHQIINGIVQESLGHSHDIIIP
jgi:hypothetical protein